MPVWDPERYLTYADERGRPFVDLLARVGAVDPARVVDLGCGPGNLTRLLAERWPGADVVGIDSSPEMIAAARESASGPASDPASGPASDPAKGAGRPIRFEVGDLRSWAPAEPVDVLLSNATLQWVPGHLDLLADLVARVRPGGWLAFQVPGNFAEPSHTLRAEIASRPPYAAHVAGVDHPDSLDPAVYLDALAGFGRVDAWETTYLHLLTGPDPVFTWVSGTGARPTLQALPDDLRPAFEEEFRAALRTAYPAHDYGVVLPFRRVFVVLKVAR